ncbi:hypothetical protein A2662_01435 [Candidatus Giovannonibacteria bacterium RIFCSPHIGHO2_01_FULL_45_33]|uniref:Response regulatory domain-containing protein n=1 Tax=Candidatus Giovannonibacteria bacterium RIFCSPLOWO2_01_FULL_45_34 TaxID=1798351 RepID=A0A1F5WZU4_9BACT|nr:MAG: hypothetical protein A2662_01435 [Candidatus Giovannonibacteria bacterium RIFCSPHIGHO2_01_FULL_45_33]OGF69679.1 MAG: hypothetical protein A3C73_00055 [Candidatus Giovannonibacteria bacterium RIFCSPHIGHO2_02_FULL_44_11]OGF81157.1 MAG: hypothetical protein A2930_01150 [Candidatus Giovannonibacteria bacterium RIFCSPLOWO2_01_FULL_45_34]
MRILVVNDIPYALGNTMKTLKDAGQKEIVIAYNASEALDRLFSVEGIELVITTDFNMHGGMNGIELVKEIKRSGFKMPVWLLTSYSDVDEKLAQDFGIEKVFSQSKLEGLQNAVKTKDT